MLLDHNSRDVVFAVAGALVNIAADPECKEVLLVEDLQGCDKLVSVVRRAGLRDLLLRWRAKPVDTVLPSCQ